MSRFVSRSQFEAPYLPSLLNCCRKKRKATEMKKRSKVKSPRTNPEAADAGRASEVAELKRSGTDVPFRQRFAFSSLHSQPF